MDKNTVFTKTEEGRQALATRPAGLGLRLRSLLIMVDGKRNAADLDKLLGGGGAQAQLEQLQQAGWVAAAGNPGAVTDAPQEVPASTQSALSLADARRLMARFINDHLGPLGEVLALKVEGCKTLADLHAALPRIRDGLVNYRNQATLLRFEAEVVQRLPAV